MFKKILIIILALLMTIGCFCMVGCGGKEEETPVGDLEVRQQIEQSDFLYPDKNEDFRYDRYTYYIAIRQCLSLKSNITIPDTINNLPVYVIADNAFANQTTVKTVSISDSVVDIGVSAFENCPQLTSVKLSANLETLGTKAFYGCTALRNIEIPNTLAIISNDVFRGCESLSYFIIDEPEVTGVNEDTGEETYTTVRTIEEDAFSECPNLRYAWVGNNCIFGEDGTSDPLDGSIENLTVYGYSQSDAAKYAADHYIDFVLIQNKSQLVEFKSTARTASQIQKISQDEEFKGEELEIQIENVYVVRSAIDYFVFAEADRETVTREFKYIPQTNTEVIVFGVKVKNNTSKDISFNALNSTITVDGYAARFADFGHLMNKTLDKYSDPNYSLVPPATTSYMYFAAIVNSDWEEAAINFGNYSELLNYNFTIKSSDNITYVGSAGTAIDKTEDSPLTIDDETLTEVNETPAEVPENEETTAPEEEAASIPVEVTDEDKSGLQQTEE